MKLYLNILGNYNGSFVDNLVFLFEYLLVCLKCLFNDKVSLFNVFWLIFFNYILVDCKEFYFVSILDKKVYN